MAHLSTEQRLSLIVSACCRKVLLNELPTFCCSALIQVKSWAWDTICRAFSFKSGFMPVPSELECNQTVNVFFRPPKEKNVSRFPKQQPAWITLFLYVWSFNSEPIVKDLLRHCSPKSLASKTPRKKAFGRNVKLSERRDSFSQIDWNMWFKDCRYRLNGRGEMYRKNEKETECFFD